MIQSSKKDEQHVVPRTYLKHWRISANENFVYGIDFSNQYRKDVQTFGLNHRVFKQRKYYNHNSFQNPYILEDILGEDFEPTYDVIMEEVNKEINLSFNVREKIMHWLYISKMRSPYMRDNTEELMNFIIKTSERYKNKNIDRDKEAVIENYSKNAAKRIHLSSFSEQEQVKKLLTLYIETLNAKQWRILKSTPEFEFWTNDNPGFSPNTVARFAEQAPYHPVMEMNHRSIILFPLSPKYCLEVSPFTEGTQLETCALNMEIKYVQAPLPLIEFINKGVLYTLSKIVISNKMEMLQHCIKRI